MLGSFEWTVSEALRAVEDFKVVLKWLFLVDFDVNTSSRDCGSLMLFTPRHRFPD